MKGWHVPESSTGTLRSKDWPPLPLPQVTRSLSSLQSSVSVASWATLILKIPCLGPHLWLGLGTEQD